MPIKKLLLQPGINTQKTFLLNEGGWSVANLIRFREGLPEVYGGWQPFSTIDVQGVCRGMHAWSTLAGIATLGAGTNQRLYVFQGNTPYDVTPVATTTTPTNPFTTTLHSATVTVLDSGQTIAPMVGEFVEISGGTAVGGLTLTGEYVVVTVISSTSYTITAAAAATSAATGGGTPTLAYLVMPGGADQMPANGWGAGTWGQGTWGTPRSGATAGTQLPAIWTLDNFGEQMIACPRGGGIYVWLPSGGVDTRAVILSAAPTIVNSIFVSNSAEQIVALGTNPASGGNQDPMLVSWCNSGDYGTWIAAAANNAGNFHLTDGSVLLYGCRSAQQNLIWSDTALYSMQFISGELVYSFQQLGTACGLLGPNAAASINGAAFWMSGLNFMWYNGVVQVLDCPVRDIVYKNLNRAQVGKVFCGLNSQFNEVRWDYPSLNATENDSYVIYNFAESSWTFGSNVASGGVASVARTAWEDINVFGTPLAFDATGASWAQETGYAAGQFAMAWNLQSGDIDIAEGQEMMFCDFLEPDQIMTGGSLMAIGVTTQRYSADAPTTAYGNPFLVSTATEYIPLRLRGRQMSVSFSNHYGQIGLFWRLGALRVRMAADGRF
jgi:hypothetical protein